MTLRTVDAYGAPSFGARPGTEMIVFHTPENASIGLQSAIDIARWQATAANTSRGSYHGILALDAKGEPVMVRSVPWNLAAGGLSTRRDAIWAPDRYPWIRSALSARAFADPNAYAIQIAISGRTRDLIASGYGGDRLIRALAEWVQLLEKAYRFDALLTGHFMWQTNRSDPGPDLANRVLDAYLELTAPPPKVAIKPIDPPRRFDVPAGAKLNAYKLSADGTRMEHVKATEWPSGSWARADAETRAPTGGTTLYRFVRGHDGVYAGLWLPEGTGLNRVQLAPATTPTPTPTPEPEPEPTELELARARIATLERELTERDAAIDVEIEEHRQAIARLEAARA